MNDLRRAVPALLLLALAACSPPAPTARPPLEGARIGGPFALSDQDGKSVTDRSFAGRYRIVYFGYTYCPDVCPVDVQNLAAALRLLERDNAAKAARIVPIFVTVDPARDTAPVVRNFVRAFHPRMIGLTGDPAAIAAAAKAYGIYYQLGERSAGGGYLVDHSRVAYLMNPDGKPLALLSHEAAPRVIAEELERWVK